MILLVQGRLAAIAQQQPVRLSSLLMSLSPVRVQATRCKWALEPLRGAVDPQQFPWRHSRRIRDDSGCQTRGPHAATDTTGATTLYTPTLGNAFTVYGRHVTYLKIRNLEIRGGGGGIGIFGNSSFIEMSDNYLA